MASMKTVAGGLAAWLKRIELDPLAIGDRRFDVGVAAALQDRAQQRIALIVAGRQRDIAVRHLLLVARRQDQIFAARALVDAGRADVFQRRLPGVHDAAVDDAIVGRRDLDHHRPVLRVEEGHEVDDVRIGRQRLVLPVEQAGPVDDLVWLAAELSIAWYMRSVLTAGMPQITASTARRSMVRRLRSCAEGFCASANAVAQTKPNAVRRIFFMSSGARAITAFAMQSPS